MAVSFPFKILSKHVDGISRRDIVFYKENVLDDTYARIFHSDMCFQHSQHYHYMRSQQHIRHIVHHSQYLFHIHFSGHQSMLVVFLKVMKNVLIIFLFDQRVRVSGSQIKMLLDQQYCRSTHLMLSVLHHLKNRSSSFSSIH